LITGRLAQSQFNRLSQREQKTLLEKLQLATFVDHKENDFLVWGKNKIAEFFSHKVIVGQAGVCDEQSNSTTTNYFTLDKISGNISMGSKG